MSSTNQPDNANQPVDTLQPDDTHDNAQVDETSFFSAENLKILPVPWAANFLNGLSIGFVGVYAQMYLISTDCSMYESPEACDTVPNADCAWNGTADTCGWDGFTCEDNYREEEDCINDDRCNWIYSDDKCMNPTGYTATYSGVFAAAMIVGCMFGAIYAGQFIARFGHKVSFLVIGIVSVLSCVLYHVAAGVDQFWVLCAGRLIIGVVLGLVCVASPVYVCQNAPKKWAQVDMYTCGIFATGGIMFSALMGLALEQSINYKKDVKIVARLEGFCAFSTFFSALVVVLAIFMTESKVQFRHGDGADGKEEEEDAAALDADEYSYWQMLGPLAMGGVTAAAQQLTGINAVMNYAPTMMDRLGMEPLIGNFVVMLWNWLTPILAIPLARYFTMRRIYLTTMFVGSAACLFLCGIPVYPGVADEKVKNGVAITGIIVFIAAFEFGIGPGVGVLAQQLSPLSFRPKATAVTMVIQFIFNILINVLYPIATENISGGPSGNQDKGQAVAFIFFGAMGFICYVLSLLFLFPWEEKKPTDAVPHLADEVIDGPLEHSPVEVDISGNRQAV